MTAQIPSLAALSACHFVSFYPNMARNPAQADMFAYISELNVKLKYVEDCSIDNIEALDCL